jgi:hypothetical protein
MTVTTSPVTRGDDRHHVAEMASKIAELIASGARTKRKQRRKVHHVVATWWGDPKIPV